MDKEGVGGRARCSAKRNKTNWRRRIKPKTHLCPIETKGTSVDGEKTKKNVTTERDLHTNWETIRSPGT